MDSGGLFLNWGNVSFKHGRAANDPEASKARLWNSGGGPSTGGAVHVSLTAVVEPPPPDVVGLVARRRHQPLAASCAPHPTPFFLFFAVVF